MTAKVCTFLYINQIDRNPNCANINDSIILSVLDEECVESFVGAGLAHDENVPTNRRVCNYTGGKHNIV